MLEQAVCRERLSSAGSLRYVQRNIPFPEPQSDVSKMVALICHDLRLPLTAILANAEFLTESNISGEEKNEFYQEIRWSIDRMNELITSLLECSKGCDAFRPAVRNIVDTIERAIRMTTVKHEFGRITIKHHHKVWPWAGSIPTSSREPLLTSSRMPAKRFLWTLDRS